MAHLGPCHLEGNYGMQSLYPGIQGTSQLASSLHSCGLDPNLSSDLGQDSFGMIKGMFVEEAVFVWFFSSPGFQEAEPGMSVHVKVILTMLPGKTGRRVNSGTGREEGAARCRMEQRLEAGTSAQGSPACWLLHLKAPWS